MVKKRWATLLLSSVLVLVVSCVTPQNDNQQTPVLSDPPEDFMLVAYYPLYAPLETAKAMDFSRFTHINIEAVFSSAQGELIVPSYFETPGSSGMELIDYIVEEGHSGGAKVLLTLGYSNSTLEMVESEESRARFCQEILSFCRDKDIDGIDLDLEGDFDSRGYQAFAQLLRNSIEDSDFLISAAVSGSPQQAGHRWTDEFLACCDYINVMVYDLLGSWEGSPVGNHASYEGFLQAAQGWSQRLAKNRIVLGTPLYGRTFTDQGGLLVWGRESWSSNAISYGNIIEYFPESLRDDTMAGGLHLSLEDLLLSEDGLTAFNRDVLGDYSNSSALTGNEMLGRTYFSGPELSRQKTLYALENDFAGMMILKLSQDAHGPDSIIEAVYQEIQDF